MSSIESIAKNGIRVAKVRDQQISGEELVHRAGSKLTKIINEMREPALVLDMGNVKFMASAMIGKLVLLNNQCQSKKIAFSICSLDKQVAEAIQLTRIDQILPMYTTQSEALKAAASACQSNTSSQSSEESVSEN